MDIKNWLVEKKDKLLGFYEKHKFGVYVTIASILILAVASTVVPGINSTEPQTSAVPPVEIKAETLPPAPPVEEKKPVSVVKNQNSKTGHKDLMIEKKVEKTEDKPAKSTKYKVEEDTTLQPDYAEALKAYKLLSGQQ